MSQKKLQSESNYEQYDLDGDGVVTDEELEHAKLIKEDGVVDFWSEHSARACLPLWVACLAKFPKDWLDHLGRWSGGRSET